MGFRENSRSFVIPGYPFKYYRRFELQLATMSAMLSRYGRTNLDRPRNESRKYLNVRTKPTLLPRQHFGASLGYGEIYASSTRRVGARLSTPA